MKKFVALTAAMLAAGLSMGAVSRPATAHGKEHHTCTPPTFGPGAKYHPTIHPADFSADVTNAYFPLEPGTTFVYAGEGRQDGDACLRRVKDDEGHRRRAYARSQRPALPQRRTRGTHG